MKKLPREVLADLKRSGLTPADATRLGITYEPEFCPRPGTLGAPTLRAYRLPYFTQSGKVNGFSRLRLLDPYTPPKAKKAAKYLQDAGTEPKLYLPPFIKWQQVASDQAATLYATEGEKKAAAMCKLGLPAIGLGGVWNWRTGSHAIDDFNLFEWRGRRVKIVFDSDARHKTDVQQAQRALADELIRRGAVPISIDLPTLPRASKTGADDFLVRYGSGAKAKRLFLALPDRPLLIPQGYTFAEIASKKLPAPRWAVADLIPVGLTELVGKPKVGKSWLALDITTAVAAGSKALGTYATERGAALHLALEDTERRFQDRLRRVLDGQPAPSGGHFFARWPGVEEHGLDALRRWLDAHSDARLVVIDTLAKMRARPTGTGNMYHEDYAAIEQLKFIADERGIGIVVIHHLRKAASDDPLDLVSGSTGLTGAADTIIVLRRERSQADASLYITGRDVTEQELALQLEPRTMRWRVLGNAADYRMSTERKAIVDALTAFGRPVSPHEVADAIGKSRGAVKKLMLKMANQKELRWHPEGKYELEGVKGRKK